MDKQTNFINIGYIKCYVFTTQPSKRQHMFLRILTKPAPTITMCFSDMFSSG